MPKALPIDSDNLDDWFPREAEPASPALEPLPTSKRLGVVVGGSLSKGLDVKLDRQTEIERLPSGAMWWCAASTSASSA